MWRSLFCTSQIATVSSADLAEAMRSAARIAKNASWQVVRQSLDYFMLGFRAVLIFIDKDTGIRRRQHIVDGTALK